MSGYEKGMAIWFVGLPGCGKSTLLDGVHAYLYSQGFDVVRLQMDERRKAYFPEPEYTDQEREKAYRLFVDEAAEFVRQGKCVLMDGSAHKISMRTYARQRIPHFAEIFVRCNVEIAMKREEGRPDGLIIANMYKKALKRQQTGEEFEGLGDVIGVDVEFEVDADADLIIDNSYLTKDETLGKALYFLDSWLRSD